LAYVVRAIENDCASVPVGAFKLTPAHELRYDEHFKGLNPKDAFTLDSWQHFRAPQDPSRISLISLEEAVFFRSFLDPLSSDHPSGQWSLQRDASNLLLTLTSLYWPGYISYHLALSPIFGYAYFGNGLKNVNLPFMM